MSNAHGYDVSNFQGVKPVSFWNGQDFGFCKATEGVTFRDPTFAGNWNNMRAVKIHRGAYHFFHPSVDAVAQAKFFANTVKASGLEPGDMLVADVEIFSGLGRVRNAFNRFRGVANNVKPVKSVPAAAVNSSAKLFLDTLHSIIGDKNPIMVYSNLNVSSTLTACTAYPLWIADPGSVYPHSVKPWSRWMFWQYSWSPIDANVFRADSASLQTWLNSYADSKPKPPPVHFIKADGTKSLAELVSNKMTTPVEAVILTAINEKKLGAALKEYTNAALSADNTPVPAGTTIYVW